jgi:hypothetical protein
MSILNKDITEISFFRSPIALGFLHFLVTVVVGVSFSTVVGLIGGLVFLSLVLFLGYSPAGAILLIPILAALIVAVVAVATLILTKTIQKAAKQRGVALWSYFFAALGCSLFVLKDLETGNLQAIDAILQFIAIAAAFVPYYGTMMYVIKRTKNNSAPAFNVRYYSTLPRSASRTVRN